MKFEIKFSDNLYYLILCSKNELFFDEEIPKYLGLSAIEYIEILRSYNACYHFECDELCFSFKNKHDVENLIKELEPILIMRKLTGE